MHLGRVRGRRFATCAIVLSLASAGVVVALNQSGRPTSKLALSTTASVSTHPVPVSTSVNPAHHGGKPDAAISLTGFTKKSVMVNGVERTYYLQTPTRVHGPGPMIIALHGVNSSPNWIAHETGLATAARNAGVSLVIPVAQGVPAWNDGRLGANGPNDEKFLLDVVDQEVNAHVADPHRVVICGFSNGASMTMTMASLYPKTFAAFVSVAGELPSAPDAARPTSPIPAYLIHGMNDPVQPYGGRSSNNHLLNATLSEDQTVAAFVKANRAGSPLTKSLPHGPAASSPIQQITYPAGSDGASVTLYKLPGVGHRWPVSSSTHPTDTAVVPAGLDTNALITRVATTTWR